MFLRRLHTMIRFFHWVGFHLVHSQSRHAVEIIPGVWVK